MVIGVICKIPLLTRALSQARALWKDLLNTVIGAQTQNRCGIIKYFYDITAAKDVLAYPASFPQCEREIIYSLSKIKSYLK